MFWSEKMVTLIFTTRTTFVTRMSPATLISVIYPHHKVPLHTLWRPYYIRQCDEVICTHW